VKVVVLVEVLLPVIIGGHHLWTLFNLWKTRSIHSILFYPSMVEPVYINVFDRYSGPIVSLKLYGEYNNQTMLPEWNSKECNSVLDVPEFVEKKDTGGLFAASSATYLKGYQKKSLKKRGQEKICSIKHYYHMYIPQAIVKKLIAIVAQAKTVQVICMSYHWLNMLWTIMMHYFPVMYAYLETHLCFVRWSCG